MNSQFVVLFSTGTFSAALGIGLGFATLLKIQHIAQYALGKILGQELAKDLKGNILVMIPYRQSIFKAMAITCISSLLAYKISSIAAFFLFDKQPLLSSIFRISSAAFPVMFTLLLIHFHDLEREHEGGVYLSQSECQKRNIDAAQINFIKKEITMIYDIKSLFTSILTFPHPIFGP